MPGGRVGAGPAARRDGATALSRDASLDEAVRAMGHPGRRAMLRLARDEERTAAELAEVARLSPSAASPHLKILRETGLMHVRVDAKRRLYRVDLQRLAQVRAALGRAVGRSPRRAQDASRSGQAGSTDDEATVGVKLVDQRLFIDAAAGARATSC